MSHETRNMFIHFEEILFSLFLLSSISFSNTLMEIVNVRLITNSFTYITGFDIHFF